VWDRPIAARHPARRVGDDAGYTSEEWKLVRESRKIPRPEPRRHRDLHGVPVYVGHAMTANVQFAAASAATRLTL
jgi:aspartate-semialdehyde dehydrogenase